MHIKGYNTYRFGRFGTLISHKGLPLYMGDELITPHALAWWWPVNWVAVIFALPFILLRHVGRMIMRSK